MLKAFKYLGSDPLTMLILVLLISSVCLCGSQSFPGPHNVHTHVLLLQYVLNKIISMFTLILYRCLCAVTNLIFKVH